MTDEANHICVCICTYKRPNYLKRLLDELRHQETGGRFTFSIVVCDNDEMKSGETVVAEFAGSSSTAIKYCLEEHQNISLARNKTIENSSGNYIAFIDDDEFPDKCWLLNLFEAIDKYQVDGVLGPVKRYFDTTPPKWLLKSTLYERIVYPTGTVLHESEGRTGNVLLKKGMFDAHREPFNPKMLTGGDTQFFRDMIEFGYRFIWSADALVYEVVPPIRWKRSFILRRALFRGAHVPLRQGFSWRLVIKSMIALPAYLLMLPVAVLIGQHRVMTIMMKLCDHLGLLLAIVGIRPSRQTYITE